MTAQGRNSRIVILGAAMALSAPLVSGSAEAARRGHPAPSHGVAQHGAASSRHAAPTLRSVHWTGGSLRSSWRYARLEYAALAPANGGLQCVPYARENSGIELVGNAATWWGQAAGVYARGNQPEVGSVLAFRATGRIPLGHVAVVTDVTGPRSVEIDHANWAARGRVSQAIHVEDVSPANDWTAVRVALASGEMGSVYPTYGFIYDRPDGAGVALASAPGAQATPEVARGAPEVEEEVAELPDASERRVARAKRHPRLQADEARRRHRHHHRRHG